MKNETTTTSTTATTTNLRSNERNNGVLRSFAVCGFEAFINGKHIIGEVKEKEQAHKEYREAISRGHGAYLMDEETPVRRRLGNLLVSSWFEGSLFVLFQVRPLHKIKVFFIKEN